jgi:transcriptional regulator with XRE-family HTH domain
MMVTLEAARVNAGLKQSEAAEKMGITPETLSRW